MVFRFNIRSELLTVVVVYQLYFSSILIILTKQLPILVLIYVADAIAIAEIKDVVSFCCAGGV